MRKIIPAIASGAAVLAVAGGTLGFVNAQKTVSLSVDGSTRQLSTMQGTVADVLSGEGVVIGDHDLVAPAPSTPLSEGTVISVQYGRQLTVSVDGKQQRLWTTARNVGDALNALQLNQWGSDLSTSRSTSIGRQGLSLQIDTLKSIKIQQGRKTETIKTTAATVAEALDAAKITMDDDDEISTPTTSAIADGSSIRVIDVATKKVTKKTSVDFSTTYKKTADLTKGETRTDRAGEAGVRTTTYRETRKDGKLTEKQKLSSSITTDPVTRIVLVGTKAKAEPKSGGSNYASGSTVWDKLAKCESGGNWAINTGNGYSGGLQFSTSTWQAYGGSGKAYQHSRSQQIAIAEKIRADVGYSAWPACSSKLGLR